jgi:hypothetical protein
VVAAYRPATQLTQLAAPVSGWPVPTGQPVHCTGSVNDDAHAEKKPPLQGSHCALPDCAAAWPSGHVTHTLLPVAAVKLPAAQPRHVAEPARAATAPAAQGAHAARPLAAKLPAEQTVHCDDAVAPVVAKYWPAAQAVQLAWALAGWKVPTAQNVQSAAPLLAAYCPAAHAEQPVAAASEKVPVVQLAHALEVVDPEVVRYVPAAQLVHPVWATSAAYLPAEQLVHCAAPKVATNMPAGHEEHALAPPAAYWPELQLRHVADAAAPVAAE